MILPIYLIFAATLILSLFKIKFTVIRDFLLIVLASILIYLAATRPSDVANDYLIYVDYWHTKFLKDVESSFIHIRNLLKNDFDLGYSSLFVVYAVLGVSAKVYGIRLFTKYVFLSLLVYISHYYILHELTQIRVGGASGFFIIALYFLTTRDYVKFFIFILIAGYFHYSAFLALPLCLIYNDSRKINLYILLIPIGYIIYFTGSSVIVQLPIPYVQEKVRVYEELKDAGFNESDKINVFNALFLMRIAIFIFIFFFRKKIALQYDKIYLLLKVYSIALFTFTALASIPAFAFRIQELFGVVEILLFPCIVYIFKDKFVGFAIVVLIALSLLSLDIFYGKLLLY